VLPELPVPPLGQPDLPRAAAGYNRKATDEYIEELTDFYEAVWLQRKRLEEKVASLEAAVEERDALRIEVERLKAVHDAASKRQGIVADTLYSAERFAETLKEASRRDAESILKKARRRAREIVAAAEREREAARREAERLQAIAAETHSDLVKTLMSALDHLTTDFGWQGDPLRRVEPRPAATGNGARQPAERVPEPQARTY
jgi:cell division septum initiation protein DivIVA